MAPPSTLDSEAHEDVEDRDGTELKESSEDEDIDGPSILLDQETNQGAEVNLVAEADNVFDSWMNFSPKFNDYLIEGATPIVINRITGRFNFRDIVSIHFSTMFNGGFQKRKFSSCKHVMGVGQARIPIDTLEMKALLFHNAELICKGIV